MANTMTLSGGYDRNEVRYDNFGRLAEQAMSCAYSAVTTACPYWTTFQYDALNRLTLSQRPISASNGTLQSTTVQYAGRTTTTADPQGKKIRSRLAWSREPGPITGSRRLLPNVCL